eukprot:5751878-Pyramimonas_sp.AAC.1
MVATMMKPNLVTAVTDCGCDCDAPEEGGDDGGDDDEAELGEEHERGEQQEHAAEERGRPARKNADAHRRHRVLRASERAVSASCQSS